VKKILRLMLPAAMLAIVVAFAVSLLANHTAFAAPAVNGGEIPAATGTATGNHCGQSVSCVIAFGDARIAERITALQKLIDRVNNRAHLTSDQKNAIISSATNAITGLQGLKATLDKETSVTNARADVKSIYVTYRIFAVQLPLDYATMVADLHSYVQMTLANNESTIDAAIQKAGSPGNTTQLYQDLVAKVSDAATQISAAQGLFPNMIPANYPGTQQTFQQIRTDLKTAHADLETARDDLKQIIAALKAAK
jgi:hypothetical protein